MKTKIKTLQKRIDALSQGDIVTIQYMENGIYKQIKMKYNEARKMVLEQIELNL